LESKSTGVPIYTCSECDDSLIAVWTKASSLAPGVVYIAYVLTYGDGLANNEELQISQPVSATVY